LPTKPDPLLAQAQALVAAAYDPAKTSLEAQRQQALAEAAARQQAIQGFAQAGAEQVAPIGGQVQAGYQDAAARTATYSKGFSVGMQLAQQGSADDINSFLAKNGSPVGQQVQGNTGAADVLYGSTGFIPASGLEREGAAFGAAARQLPATMLGRGQQLQYESQRESQKTDREYLAELSKIEAERPGAVQKALLELKDAALKERAQRVDEQIAIEKLGIDRKRLGLESDRVGISLENAKTSRMNANTQRYNSQLRKLQNDRSYQATLKRLGLQEAGLAIRATELEAKKRSGGFTKNKLLDLKADALATARAAVDGGYRDKDGVWVPVHKRPVDVLRDLLDHDVPFSVAISAIQAVGRQAGKKNPAWRATLQWTRKPKKKK
jgi:hypothetical protein